MASGKIPNDRIRPSHYEWSKRYPRLNDKYFGYRSKATPREFVNVDLGPGLKTVTAFATQGFLGMWVESFRVSFSKEGAEWFQYMEDGDVKVLLYVAYSTILKQVGD